MTNHAGQKMPIGIIAVLMASVFTVSMGFGVVLPLLPYLIERLLGEGGNAGQVAQSTGLLTGLYMFALFLFAPMWGKLSDRYGRRNILVIGLTGFAATMATFAFIETLAAVYAERFLSGMFAAAVTPVALAAIGDIAAPDQTRARRLTFVSLAGVTGFLLGPMVGVFIAQGAAGILPATTSSGSLAFPLAATALLAFMLAALTIRLLPRANDANLTSNQEPDTTQTVRMLMPRMLVLAFIVSAAVGVFEVGLALRGKQELGLTQYQVAIMFTECSLVMIIVQAIVFSPWIKAETTRWFIAPALAVLAIGLFLVPRADDFAMMLLVVGAVAASAGIISPILTYWISSKAGHSQGSQMGKQTAAASLGAAIGSAGGGLLFNVAWLPDASFVLIAGLTVLGLVISFSLPQLLMKRHHDETDVRPAMRLEASTVTQPQRNPL